MVHFRVFLGAPSAADVDADPNNCVWQTIQEPSSAAPHSQSFPYPPATLNAASRRISLLYQNVIFDSISEQEPEPSLDHVLASQQDDDDADRPGMSLSTGLRGPANRTMIPRRDDIRHLAPYSRCKHHRSPLLPSTLRFPQTRNL